MAGETILDTFITRFGFKTDKKGLEEGKKGLKDFKSTAIKVAAGIGAILAGGFFLRQIAVAADETIKWADANGIVVESLGELEFAVARQGGTAEGLRGSLSNLNKSIGEVERGTGRAKLAFEDYGLTVKKTNGQTKTADELFVDLNKKFVTLSRAQQFDLAMKMGIDKGTILLLQTAPEQIAELRKEAAKLGVLSRRDAVKAAEFMDGLTNIGQALNAIKFEIGGMVFEPLAKFFKIMADGMSFIRRHKEVAFVSLIGILASLVIAFNSLAAAALTAWGITLGPIIAIPALIALAVTAIAVLAEDLNAFFTGQDSFLGDLIEKWEKLEGIWGRIRRIGEGTDDSVFGRMVKRFNERMTLGNDAGSPVPIGAVNQSAAILSGPGRAGGGKTVGSVNINNLNVDATGGDSKEIAQNVSSALKDQLQNTVEDVDSDIER